MQWTYTPSRSPTAKVQRRVVQWRRACTAEVAPDRPVITFTFDDFPKAALNGADVLEKHGGRGGFYACTSMMGMRSSSSSGPRSSRYSPYSRSVTGKRPMA